MTKQEIKALESIIRSIENIASLENACFNSDIEKDKEIKNTIRPYMVWFDGSVQNLKNMIKYSQKGDRTLYKECLEAICKDELY